MKNYKIVSGVIWKLLERLGVQSVQFVVQLVLARILNPEHYGALSIIVIFVNLAQVFIQTGFNTSLIQNKDVTEEDYSSVFWVTLVLATVSYVVLFFAAPMIASFYKMPEIVAPFRVISLMLFPATINSVQVAKVSREMEFRKIFYCSIGAVLASGAVGVLMACYGFGLWALVVQSLVNTVVSCGIMWFTVNWRPRLIYNRHRVRVLISYGWKLLVSGLLDTLYSNLSTLVVGKKYDSEMLAYYNRGLQFPTLIITAVNGAVQSVMLPAMSGRQNEPGQVKALMRNAVRLSAYVIFPVMAGLAAVAEPLVRLLLTDKWLPCVPYLQIFCLVQAFYPVNSANVQAIAAMGRSDIFLKLEIEKKVIGIIILAIAVFAFESPIAIAASGVLSTVVCFFINAHPNKKLIGYSYWEQAKDLMPSFLVAFAMFLVVWLAGKLELSSIGVLVVQILIGIVFYVAASAVLRLQQFTQLKQMLKELRK